MVLPSPLPDDPRKWDGWRHFGSLDLYERLCLSLDANPTDTLIEEHCRQLLVWWQKKLPLKNQPSNPIAQLLRNGLDAAPQLIAEARSELLIPERRAEIDDALFARRRRAALTEFQKFLDFALADKVLTGDAEAKLFKLGRSLGLRGPDVTATIHDALVIAGAARAARLPPPVPLLPASGVHRTGRSTRRVTRRVSKQERLSPDEEHSRFPKFYNSIDAQMLLVPTGRFLMGSHTPEAPIDEQPATQMSVRRFYLSRHPVTHAQYERFDPAHAEWRSARADDDHPVVYVSYFDAASFCAWLSEREGKRYRLPSEAEWEYAARGTDGRMYPWAPTKKLSLAKFTLTQGTHGRTGAGRGSVGEDKIAPNLEDGCAGTSPVGSYPLGASPFGIEDLIGNVWEWCQDFYDTCKGTERMNLQGPPDGSRRVFRGGSWKLRAGSVRATTRGSNLPTYASNDVGFRLVCECDEVPERAEPILMKASAGNDGKAAAPVVLPTSSSA